ncbi:unnamed protein product, partial [Meganyctiphanes norvegica]
WSGAVRQSAAAAAAGGDSGGAGSWVWPDGSPVPADAWAQGQPNKPTTVDCAYISSSTGLLYDYSCSYTSYTLCQECSVGKSNELTMAVTVDRETNTIEVVPMCVNNNDYYLTLDGIVLETSPNITRIENVTPGHHEVCIKANYDGEPKTLCFQVIVCSSNFPHWSGEYCFHIGDGPHTQISAENYCLDMSASLPYPMDDLNEWQTAMNAAITDWNNDLDLPWSGATMQSGQNWTWSNGDQVQTTAWATGQPAESESCSVIDSEGLLNEWACSQSRPKVLCQATYSTITTTTTSTMSTSAATTTITTITTITTTAGLVFFSRIYFVQLLRNRLFN